MKTGRQMPPGDQLGKGIGTNREANGGGYGATSADIARGYVKVPQPGRFDDRPIPQESPEGFVNRYRVPIER